MTQYTVLYVDDEPDLLILGKTFLESIGDFIIDTRESARDGLAALRSQGYDVVISDYMMPEMDGLEFLKAVRNEFGNLPFILFTGRGREAVIIEAIDYGVDFYLQKGGDVKAQFAELAHKINMAVERKKAVDERLDSEKRLSALFHASPIHQMISDFSTGRIIDINDRFLGDLRLTREDVIGRTPEEIGFTVDPVTYSAILEQLVKEGTVRNVELHSRTRDGRIHTSLTSMTRVQAHGQDLIYTQSIDITAQKKAQQTIDALLNAPPDVSMLFDTRGKILAVNDAASQRYGIPVNELIGMDSYTLVSPDFAGLRRQRVNEVLQSKQPLVFVDDQSSRAYENHLYPVLDPSGNVSAIAVHSIDITDERKAKEALRQSEEKYRLVVEHSHDTIYIYRGDHFLFINRQAEELTGFTHEELMKRELWDFIHPDDRAELKERALKRFAGGELSSSFQARILRKDGSVREGEFFVDLITYLEEPAILGIARDITEKKRAEEAILEREQQLRSLADNLPNGMIYQIMAEPDGHRRFIHVSAGVEKLHEISVDDAMRDSSFLYRQISEDFRDDLLEAEERAFASLSPFNFEMPVRTPSGKKRWILIRSAPRRLPSGETIWDGIELDVTAARQSEEELKAAYEQLSASQEELQGQFDALRHGQELLQESEEKYRTLVEQTENGVFIARDQNLIFVNRALAEMAGYTVDELTGAPLGPLVAPEDREHVLARHNERLTGLISPEYYEFHILHKDKKTRLLVRIRVGTVKYQGQPATIGTIHDITEERRNEISLRESEDHYRSLLAASPDGIAMISPDGILTYVSPKALEMFGLSRPEEAVGTHILTWLADTDREFAALRFRDVISDRNDTGSRIYTMQNKDKKSFIIEMHSAPLHDSHGAVTGIISVMRDITERIHAEAALAQSEELLRKTMISIPDIIVRADLEGKILFINDKGLQLVGETDPDAVTGRSMFSFFAPECLPLAQKNTRLMFERPLGPVEYVFINKAGEHVNLEVNGDVLRNPDGVPYGLVFLCRDLTERRRAETALRESEERYRRFIHNLFDAVVIYQDDKIVLANDTAARIAGLETSADLVGRPALSFVHPDFRAQVLNRQKRMLDTPDEISPLIPEKFMRIDGSDVDVEVMATTTRHQGRTAILVIFRDITEQVHAREALRRSEEEYRTIIENMQDVFYRTDSRGIITMISTYGAHLVGFDSVDEIIGKYRATDFYPDPSQRDELIATLLEKGRVSGYEITLKDRFGNMHYATASSRLIRDHDGNIIGIDGILHDITALKDVENALRQANRQIRLMTAITRHDIRNQLLALNSWLELSRAAVSDRDRMLEIIAKEQQIAGIIAEQIDFTTLFDSMGAQPPEWQDPAVLVMRIKDTLPFGKTGLELDLPGIEIFADPLLEKVFYNLIDNSLRYGGDQLSMIRITAGQEDKILTLVIEDNGKGIPGADKKRIFERGFGRNTGLGLFLVSEILGITDLSISETGPQGQGARFEIRVPPGRYRCRSA